MEKEKDIEERARAKAWLDMAQAKWRLQTMQHRSRYNPKTGEYRELPTRIRRFLNGTPVGMKTEVLALLKESAPYQSPVFDCETDPGLKYRPTNTFIRKDGVEHATGGKDPTYTIIQDLLLDDGRDDTFVFGDESACSQLGETEYHWDEPDVMDCPDGGQGVSYQITDINRDRESDLFSYRVRKVQTLTTHLAPHVSECDGRKRVVVEQWDGVYGEPGAFRQDPVRGGSAPIEVPGPCGRPQGETVKVDVYRNPDCTYRLTFQTAYAVADDLGQYSVYKDQYKSSDSVRRYNQTAALPRAGVDYSGGVTTRYTSERNEDGTWNNSVETETERPVANSTVEHRITPRGRLVSRVDTNQPSSASDASLGTQFGSWKSTKTPGGLFTNEYSEYTRSVVDNLGLTCNDTLFLHTHETQSSVAAVPAAGTDVPTAAGGVVTTWTYDTDSEGFVTRRERTESEHRVDYATKRKVNGYLGTSEGYTHRSVPKSVADAAYGAGAEGTTVEVRRTNGDLYDVEVQSFRRVSGATLGLECAKTVYQHVHETAESAAAVGSCVAAAGGGLTYRRTYTVDPTNGAITVRAQTTQEILVSESRRSVRVTARGTTVQSTTSNSPTHQADASAAGASTEWEVTPGGRFNCTTVTTTPRQGSNGTTCEEDAFLHSHGTTATSDEAPAGDVGGGSGGTYRERAARLGDDGLWEVTTTEHVERQGVDDGVDVSVTARGMRKTVKTRQRSQPAEPGADEAGRALRSSRTRGGLYNVEETTTTPRPGPSAEECSQDLFLHAHSTGSTKAEADPEHVDPVQDMSGLYASRRQQLGDDGLWSVVDTSNQERAVPRQRVEERVTKHGRIRRTTDAQTTSEGAELQATVANIGKERVFEKTRGGRRNLTTTDVTPVTGKTDESCEKTAFLHTHVDVETLSSKQLSHVADAADGKHVGESWTVTDAGTWERRHTEHQELTPQLQAQQYQDAFGETTVTEEFSNDSESGGKGGKQFQRQQLVQSVESTMTNGRRYNVRTRKETPREVDSGWITFRKRTDRGLAVYYDFIVFRNASKTQVLEWKRHAESITYEAGSGSFANHPSISIAPNKFELWDGTISLTTTFTPKEWSAGGNTKNDNWETDEIEVLSVNFVPLNASKLLKIVTKEWHKKGGGVGKDKLEGVLEGGLIKGSQFSFHPGGQVFSYDVITKVETKGVVMDMPQQSTGGSGTTLWDGTMP